MKDQNEISDLITEFRASERQAPDNGARILDLDSEHDLLLLNRVFSWLFNIRGIKPSDNWPV